MNWFSQLLKRRLSRGSKLLVAFILSLCCASGGMSDKVEILLKRFENRSIDYRFLIRGPSSQRPDISVPIVVVFIDNDSALSYGYRSPTPRLLLADLATELSNKGASVIGIDVLLDKSYNAQDDEMLEQAFQMTGDKVVLVTDLYEDYQNRPPYSGILPNFGKLTHQGFSVSKSEGDDFHRWVNVGTYGDQIPFAAKIYKLYTGKDVNIPQKLLEISPWILVNFPGPPSRVTDEVTNFQVVSAQEVSGLPDAVFRNKIVLIGSAIEDLGDTFLIPFSTQENSYKPMFGVEFHAITLSMFLKNNYIFELQKIHKKLLLLIFFFGVATAFMFLKPILALLFLPVSIFGWSTLSVVGFLKYHTLLPMAYPIGSIIFIFIICQWLIHLTELRHSKYLKNTFQHYISPDLVEQLVSKQEEVALGGIRRELTIFFSDLKGFTTFSESMPPEALMEFLHLYFDEMTKILFDEKGTLDKYIGDAVMAFFGAPTPMEDHAIHACRTALLMQKRLDELNKDSTHPKWFQVEVRIGINSGEVIVGNSGSKTRFNYTVIGDNVNLAARLEGANKLFGSRILISEFTLSSVNSCMQHTEHTDKFFTRELGKFVVKGKAKPVAVYELIDFEANITSQDPKRYIKQQYEQALNHFYKADFIPAREIFLDLKNNYHDKASEFMLSQIHYLLHAPPQDGWSGEIILSEK